MTVSIISLCSYNCDCEGTGFEGENCTVDIDDCLGNPCQNGASCEDRIKVCNVYVKRSIFICYGVLHCTNGELRCSLKHTLTEKVLNAAMLSVLIYQIRYPNNRKTQFDSWFKHNLEQLSCLGPVS